jgi:hypothetical protein
MKLVGRRRMQADTLEDQGRLARTAAALRGTPALAPRGVYRFASFDEADQWMTTTLRRTHERRSRLTSSVSAGH